jgi:hypothetical protein
MIEASNSKVDVAIREMERTIFDAINGALCVFERSTGLQVRGIHVHMSPYLEGTTQKYEIDVVRCLLPDA